MIIAVAIRTKDGRVLISRNSHSEILMMHPEDFKTSEQGFITDELKFVDREEGLQIAIKNNQITKKHGLETELYSEDIFLNYDKFKVEAIKEIMYDKEAIDKIIEIIQS